MCVRYDTSVSCSIHINKCALNILILTALLGIANNANNAGIVRLISDLELISYELKFQKFPQSKVFIILLCLIDGNCRKQSCNKCEYRTNSSGELKEHSKSM